MSRSSGQGHAGGELADGGDVDDRVVEVGDEAGAHLGDHVAVGVEPQPLGAGVDDTRGVGGDE
jgi:hypothetical protein